MKKYIGIRYATAERFGKPIPTPDLQSVDDVTCQVTICPQNPSKLDTLLGLMSSGEMQSEDCLRLSIFTPSTKGLHPVFVWVHGGAYLTGSGMYQRYDASELLERGNIVVVNISYRMGILGFYYDPKQDIVNLGLQDQVCALQWIQRNIRLFGGDPEQVTIFGQSAGAHSVLCHIAQQRQVLFQKAIIASAPFIPATAKAQTKRTRKFLAFLNEDPKTASITKMLEAQYNASHGTLSGMPFAPVCTDIKATEHIIPGLQSVLLWTQRDDALPFVPFRFLNGIVTRIVFLWPTERYAKHLEKKGVKTEVWLLDWRHGLSQFGAIHCLELPLIFGTWEQWKDAPFLEGVSRQEYDEKSAAFKQRLIKFIRYRCCASHSQEASQAKP
ncbi:MAG: carboxylesterase family protein [Bacteroidales bacterium]|nr:carboxylesterase family protein [Bacteroidales bacterium]